MRSSGKARPRRREGAEGRRPAGADGRAGRAPCVRGFCYPLVSLQIATFAIVSEKGKRVR